MAACRHFSALMRKNLLLKWRNPCSSLCEVVLPILCVLIMIGLYGIFQSSDYPTAAFTKPWGQPEEEVRRVVPFSVVPNRLAYANWKLAIVASDSTLTPQVDAFIADMSLRYPPFNGTAAATINGTVRSVGLAQYRSPGFAAVVQKFASEGDLQAYISDSAYGMTSAPKIWAAIVFNRGAPNWDVSYRFNYTEVPDTRVSQVNTLSRGYTGLNVGKYVYSQPQAPGSGNPVGGKPSYDPTVYAWLPGFTTLQLMVDRWIIGQQAPAPAVMDPAAALYAFNYTLFFAAPSSASWIFSRELAALAAANATATIAALAQRVAASMDKGERFAPQTVDFVPYPITAYSNNRFYAIAGQIFAFFFGQWAAGDREPGVESRM